MPEYKIICPACQSSQSYWDRASTHFACGKCRALFSERLGMYEKLEIRDQPTVEFAIEPGQTGVLNDITYRVMGFAQRQEKGSDEVWQEYWLREEFTGKTAWLSEYNGHWVFGENIPAIELTEDLKKKMLENKVLGFRDQAFQLYNSYKANYKNLCGEFPYNPVTDKPVNCREYICPPYLLTLEHLGPDRDYSIAQHISWREIKKTFNPSGPKPIRIGTGAVQPFSSFLSGNQLVITALVFCALIFIIQFIQSASALNKQVFAHLVMINDSTINKPVVSSSFEITGSTSNLEIASYAIVENGWAEAGIDLVNEQTGKERSFAVGVEYYHGTDQGEAWSEGSYGSNELLCSIEPGRYHLVITPEKDGALLSTEMELTLWQDVPSWWNAWWAVAIMVILAGGIYGLEIRFERNRWYNSPYTPYTYED